MNQQFLFVMFLLAVSFFQCSQRSPEVVASQYSLIMKDSCDDPDANINCCFVNQPPGLTSIMAIGDARDSGDKLIITGIVYKPDSLTPFPDVVLYAYHTDNKGLYTKYGDEKGIQKWHGHLHGWCRSDSNGVYEIHTIRPAPYPDSSMPAHIHAAIKTPEGKMMYINDFVFSDDSLLNEKYFSSLINPGGKGLVEIKKTGERMWMGRRDIVLQ